MSNNANPWLAILACALVQTACGGGGGGGSSTPPPVTPPATIGDTITNAESSGKLPALNHDSTVAGPDTDNNGIRDDIDAFIASSTDTTVQKSALSQQAKALQSALTVDATNSAAVSTASSGIVNGIACLYKQYGAAVASQKNAQLEKITVNTLTRLNAYEGFNTAMSGTSTKIPQGAGCAN